MKYHLGCGSHYLPGYLNVDFPRDQHTVNDAVQADLYADILTMKYEPCDEIRSHHVFEHFGFVDSFKLLEKWTPVLKISGVLVVDVPDVEALAQVLVESKNPMKQFRVMRYLYGSQEASWAYHINGWTLDTLRYVLEKIGYKTHNAVRYGDPDSDFPNCGLRYTAQKTADVGESDIHRELLELLSLYANGDTDFERRLVEHWRKKL